MVGSPSPQIVSVDEKQLEDSKVAEIENLATEFCSDETSDFSWNYDVITNLIALYSCYFSSAWAMGVPASGLAFIMLEFPESTHTTTTWIATAPSLILCVVSIFIGDLSDILGRKWFLVAGTSSGVVGMLLGGLGTSIDMIIAGQAFNGLGLTLGFLATPLLAEVVPKRYRGPILSGGTLMAGLVGVGGGISQGAFMKFDVNGVHRGWRIGFYIGAGWFALALLAVLCFYHPGKRPNPEGTTTLKRILKIDWIGVFLSAAGLILFLVGMQFGGNPDPWASAKVLTMMVLGCALVVGFVIWEWKFVEQGLFPHELFQHRNFAISVGLNFIEGMVIFVAQAFMSQILVNIVTDDLLLTAVYQLPSNFAVVVGALVAGWVTAKTRESKWVAVCGVILLGMGAGLLAIMRPGISLAAFFVPTMLLLAGVGSLSTVIPVITSVCTPNRYIASGISIGTSLRGLGGAIGLVIFTQIFSSKMALYLPSIVSAAVVQAGLPVTSVPALFEAMNSHDPTAFAEVPGISAEIIEAMNAGVKDAYAASFRFVWYALIPFAAVTLITCFFLKSTKEQLNLQVASAVEQRHHQPPKNMKSDDISEIA